MSRGTFFVIDGLDGAGKSTVVERVHAHLGVGAVRTREPGGSEAAENIRELILSQEMADADAATHLALFWASRRAHMIQTIIPAISQGQNVVCDRFDTSSYAYQVCAQGGGSRLKDLFKHTRRVYLEKNIPDCYIILDIDPAVARERLDQRGGKLTHFDSRTQNFHEAVRSGFYEFKQIAGKTLHIVDASQEVDVVVSDVLGIFAQYCHA